VNEVRDLTGTTYPAANQLVERLEKIGVLAEITGQEALQRRQAGLFTSGSTFYGFVEPATGCTMWNVANAVCKEMFEAVLADFAKSIGVGKNKRAVIQLDQAGWHGPQNLSLPDAARLPALAQPRAAAGRTFMGFRR
jgi:hypothetical protein